MTPQQATPIRFSGAFALAALVTAAAAVLYWQIALFLPVPQADAAREAFALRRMSAVDPLGCLSSWSDQFRRFGWGEHFNIPVRSVAITFLWSLSCFGWGGIVCRRAKTTGQLAIMMALGYTLSGTLTFLIGWLFSTSALALAAPLLAGLALLAYRRSAFAVSARLACRRVLRCWRRSDAFERALCLLIGLTLCITFLGCLVPPSQSDAIRYHLAAPQEWIKAGQIVRLPLNSFSAFPFLAEMPFLLGLALGAPHMAALTQWVCCVATAAALASLAHRLGGRRSALVVVSIWLALPAAGVLATWPFIDHAVTMLLIMVLFSLHALLCRFSNASWLQVGILTGGAIGSKYTALPFLAGAAILALLAFAVRHSLQVRRMPWRGIATSVVIAALIGAPWYIKNLVTYGDPMYPVRGPAAQGDWTAEAQTFYMAKLREKGEPIRLSQPLAILKLPARATLEWTKFEGHFLGGIGILVALLSVAGLLRPFPGRLDFIGAVYLVGCSLGYLVLWSLTYQSNRMLLPVFALLAPLAAFGIGSISCMPKPVSALGLGCFVAVVSHGAAWSSQWTLVRSSPAPLLPYLAGGYSATDYEQRVLGHMRGFKLVDKEIQPNEKAMLIGEHRIYGAKFNAVWSDWFDTPAILAAIRRAKAHTADDLVAALRRERIALVLFNRQELSLGNQWDMYFRPRFSADEWSVFQDFLKSPYLRLVQESQGIFLYRLVDPKP